MKHKNLGKLPDDGFVRQAQIIPHIVPVSPATFWRMIKSGEFPSPVKLSERITAWPVETVRKWVNSRTGE